MDTVIGLGGAGCRIADAFSKFPQYDIYKIDVGVSGDRCYAMEQRNNPEDYEKSAPNLIEFFKDVEGEILFIVGGGGKISGACLKILKQLDHSSVNLLYVKPDNKGLTKIAALQNRLVYNVLQEYTRSGLFKKMFIVDNSSLENLIGDAPILEYNNKLNESLVNTLHYINFFNHNQPVLENSEQEKEIQRISTIGIYNIKNNEEFLFFPLQNIGHKCYYYALPEQTLKTDGKLFKAIKEKAAEDNSSYRIHTTQYDEPFAYFIANSSFIQGIDNE